MSQATESVALTYDGPLVTAVALSGTVDETIAFGYRDGDLALESVTYAGNEFNFGYDADGLLTMAEAWSIYRNDPATGLPNASGLAEWITDGNLTITPEYLAPGESLMDGAVYGVDYRISGTGVMAWSVTRNGLGQIDAKTETVDGASVSYEYTYTAAGQLDTVKKGGVLVENYAYDVQGRRTGDIDGRVYHYDDEDHLTSVEDGIVTTWYDYDEDGFLTAKEVDLDGDLAVDETTVYEYGARGELISVVLPDATVIEYVNGPSGQRIAKKVDGVVVEKYLWGGLTNLLAVLDASGNVVQRFEYAGGRLPVAMWDGTDTYYLHYDQVGSLRAITDDTGVIVREITYDCFGNILSTTGTGPEVPIAFAGGLYDADTGLTRFGFRDYDPEIGRWTAKDPIGFAGGDTDLYAYCGGEPISHTDRSGLLVLIDRGLTTGERGTVEAGLSLLKELVGHNAELQNLFSTLCFDLLEALEQGKGPTIVLNSFESFAASDGQYYPNPAEYMSSTGEIELYKQAYHDENSPNRSFVKVARILIHELGHLAADQRGKDCKRRITPLMRYLVKRGVERYPNRFLRPGHDPWGDITELATFGDLLGS